eukprot:TRINITY_DN28718_c0_g2_i1.p1 TRINITY_DN28718_c0_g2~~TRINITY_DN28718_c0_g2_i1.p1  ORF type:complete len:446 (-),score=64.51 TRINITY_DN28718_c0_g2_i1:170-1507(-)
MGRADFADFPIIDVDAFNRHDLNYLTTAMADGRKTEVVYQWIKASMIRALESGLLSAPPPILTRVFQELGTGLLKYHDAMQIQMWPFPFPYAQLCFILSNLFTILTPLYVSHECQYATSCALLTLVAVICIKGLNLISMELENPFGSDANDLPMNDLHNDMNHHLLMLLDNRTWYVPRLTVLAEYDLSVLAARHGIHGPEAAGEAMAHRASQAANVKKHIEELVSGHTTRRRIGQDATILKSLGLHKDNEQTPAPEGNEFNAQLQLHHIASNCADVEAALVEVPVSASSVKAVPEVSETLPANGVPANGDASMSSNRFMMELPPDGEGEALSHLLHQSTAEILQSTGLNGGLHGDGHENPFAAAHIRAASKARAREEAPWTQSFLEDLSKHLQETQDRQLRLIAELSRPTSIWLGEGIEGISLSGKPSSESAMLVDAPGSRQLFM